MEIDMSIWERLARGVMGGHSNDGHGSRRGYDSDFGQHGRSRAPYPAPTALGPAANALACLKCGGANVPDARFCSSCGNPLVPSNCSSCNAVMAADARFCPQCGKPRS
ncbi:MAG: adenylate cyclase [Burkholderiales bacterium]|nr:MAG: adenylate cyclase [Burkholderiales bacterium]